MKLKLKLKDFILTSGERAKKLIAYYEECKELSGEQKKERVSEQLLSFIKTLLKDVNINVFWKTIINIFLPNVISELVQIAFNLIEANIKGITK